MYGNHFSYIVYSSYETGEDPLSCTNQNTNGGQEITLMTCNNMNGNRIIVKAKRE